ncbi:MAG TPA: sulfite exporter TauE/SafE family protein [Pirellulales bacterium]|jgi:hypothetical protein
MIELAMICLGGLLGSGHCVGMCGPIALSVAGPKPHWISNLRRQLIFSCGRIFTYAVVGAMAGYAGMRMSGRVSTLVNLQAILAVLAGVMLIGQGLVSAGFVSWPHSKRLPACLAPGLLGAFLRDQRLGGTLLAGVFTGLLPCGLVYAYVALAASSGTALGGLMRMTAFGAGTVPLLVVVGASGSLLTLTTRERALRIAACFVIAMGVVSLARGAGFLSTPAGEVAAGCPMCR